MQRALLITIAVLLPVVTSACSESCAQSRYGGGRPTGTGPHYPTNPGGGSGGTLKPIDLARTTTGGTTVTANPATDSTTPTNVIVKDPPPPPEEPPEAHHDEGNENDSGNAVTCN